MCADRWVAPIDLEQGASRASAAQGAEELAPLRVHCPADLAWIDLACQVHANATMRFGTFIAISLSPAMTRRTVCMEMLESCASSQLSYSVSFSALRGCKVQSVPGGRGLPI